MDMRRIDDPRIIKVLALCGVIVLFAGCPAVDESARPPKEHGVAADWAAIRDVFDRYKKAVTDKDGEAAADLVSSATLDYYDDIRRLAATAGPAEINQQSLMNRLLITRTRLELKPARLRKLTGRDLFETGVNRGWADAGSFANQELGEIDVDGDEANAAQTNGVPTSYDFHREQGKWKLDLLAIVASVNFSFKQAAKESGQTENEFLFTLLESVTGRRVTKRVWEKPK